MLLEYRKIGFTGESLKAEEKKKRTARPCFFCKIESYFLKLFRTFSAQSDADGFENQIEIVEKSALVLNIV